MDVRVKVGVWEYVRGGRPQATRRFGGMLPSKTLIFSLFRFALSCNLVENWHIDNILEGLLSLDQYRGTIISATTRIEKQIMVEKFSFIIIALRFLDFVHTLSLFEN